MTYNYESDGNAYRDKERKLSSVFHLVSGIGAECVRPPLRVPVAQLVRASD